MADNRRLIDANDLKEYHTVLWDEALGFCGCVLVEDIDNAPTVDAVEVVHGHNTYDHNSAFKCSVCGWSDWDTLTGDGKYNYCPNCGAKMDGDGNG